MKVKNKTVNPDFIVDLSRVQVRGVQSAMSSSGVGKPVSQAFLQARVSSPHSTGLKIQPRKQGAAATARRRNAHS